MDVWDVLGKRTSGDDWAVVGGVKAPDQELALILARETHFRHKEGVSYAVRRRGESDLHVGPYEGDTLGGVTDHSYRRQEAYAGVGARLKRVAEEMAARGLRIEHPRPPAGRARRTAADAPAAAGADEDTGTLPSGADLTPEDLAAHGTAG
jgi:1,2-phenylacetyl-CoA epoxidase PaaB subunit